MAKYYMTLALLLCLALENNNIYARSHPSSHETASLPLMRTHPHPKHQPHQHVQHTSQQLQQHHTRQQRDRQPKHIAPDPTSEEEEREERYFQRLRRHLQHQREHMLKQERSYHRVTKEELKNSPNLWQLLSQGYSFDETESEMLNDAPAEEQQDELLKDYTNDLPEPAPPEIMEEPNPAPTLNSTLNITKSASGGCPKCESNRQVEQITEEELRTLRIEFVKQQILEKLRLKESPNVSAVDLPGPIFEGVTLTQTDGSNKNKDYDDYYARTNQKFILLQRGEFINLTSLTSIPTITIYFIIFYRGNRVQSLGCSSFDVLQFQNR